MSEHKWIDRSHPQTLQSAVLLSYLTAAMAIVTLIIWNEPFFFSLSVSLAIPAPFIANDSQLGYYGAIVLAGVLLLEQAALFFNGYPKIILSMIFTAALLGLLVHPQSREYVKIWFPKPKRQPPRRY